MKNILTSALLLISVAAFSQATGTKVQTTTQTTATTTLTPKAKELCHEWSLTKTENFGDQHDPTTAQKTDQLILMESGRYRLIMNGVAEGGTWTLDKANVWLTLTTDAGAIKKIKIVESTSQTLKIDYRDADDIHNILYYSWKLDATPPKGK